MKKTALFIIFLGSLFTILLGVLLKHSSIFNTSDPGFQFVIYGIYGSILLATIHTSNTKNFVLAAFALLLLSIVIFRIISIKILLYRLFYIFALAIAIFIYHRYYLKNLGKLAFGKFIPLSALMFLTNFIIAVIIGFIVKTPDIRELIFGQAGYGFIIGTGIGLGLELSEPLGKVLKFIR